MEPVYCLEEYLLNLSPKGIPISRPLDETIPFRPGHPGQERKVSREGHKDVSYCTKDYKFLVVLIVRLAKLPSTVG